jgi:protein TonB
VQVKGNRANWVTSEDYPAAAIRDGEEGAVAISVRVGADGRVISCQVTASSGHAALDEATCRVYSKRAHFTPALAADGAPVETGYADRVRWQLPAP